MLFELPCVYPHGIGFDPHRRLYWTESRAQRVCRLEHGQREVFAQFSGDARPDGMAFAADGRLFVCGAPSASVAVISPGGEVLEEIAIGAGATNCCFQGEPSRGLASRAVLRACGGLPCPPAHAPPHGPAWANNETMCHVSCPAPPPHSLSCPSVRDSRPPGWKVYTLGLAKKELPFAPVLRR
jgi:hypothetical protein